MRGVRSKDLGSSFLKGVSHTYTLRVRLVKRVEKWKYRKLVRGWKSRRIKKFWFSLMRVWLEEWKNGRMKNFFVWLERKMRGWKI